MNLMLCYKITLPWIFLLQWAKQIAQKSILAVLGDLLLSFIRSLCLPRNGLNEFKFMKYKNSKYFRIDWSFCCSRDLKLLSSNKNFKIKKAKIRLSSNNFKPGVGYFSFCVLPPFPELSACKSSFLNGPIDYGPLTILNNNFI